MKGSKYLLKSALLLTAVAGFAISGSASVTSDTALQQSIQSKLKNKEFKQVSVELNHGVVTLTGTVDRYQAKVDAEKKARKIANVKEVNDQIQVGGKDVPDAQLQNALNRKLSYDRWGYGHVWNYVVATVDDGTVTLEGEVRWQPDKDSALALVNSQEGVKDVVDKVRILPTSIFDDQLRAREFRAIYGDSSLSRYGIDPRSPIRIVVSNGHVALYGTVQSEMDRNIAGIRANGVAGAFSVENHLTVDKS
jgi:hyperosmotically inducible periplasmic protein